MAVRFRHGSVAIVAILLGMLMAGCTASRETKPPRTATEQLLISTAADRAVEKLALDIAPDTRVFVDAQYFDGIDSKYAIGAIRDRLLKEGARLVASKEKADVIVEIRSGALSVDEQVSLLGIQSFDIPIPLAGPLNLPEIALLKIEEQKGTAKFAITGYEANNGALVAASGPVYGYSHKEKWVVLLFISWSDDDLIPEDETDEE